MKPEEMLASPHRDRFARAVREATKPGEPLRWIKTPADTAGIRELLEKVFDRRDPTSLHPGSLAARTAVRVALAAFAAGMEAGSSKTRRPARATK